MRRARFVLLLPLWLTIGLPAGRAEDTKKAPEAKGPRIAVEPPRFDFGRAVQNKTLNTEFSIRNFGSEDLVIENVSTSCGCTVAALKTKIVKPGGSTALSVTLHTRQSQGKISKTVLISSNDPVKPRYELQVQASVAPGH